MFSALLMIYFLYGGSGESPKPTCQIAELTVAHQLKGLPTPGARDLSLLGDDGI